MRIPTVKFYETEIQSLADSVNGSLWTVGSETYCYIMLFFIAALGIIAIPIALVGFFAGSVLIALSWVVQLPVSQATANFLVVVPSFCAGVAMFLIHARFGMSRIIALVCLAGLVLIAPTGYLMVFFPILGAYPLIYLGTSNSIFLGRATQFGDLSYGTYLYAWPVGQIVRSVAGPSLTGYGLFLITLPLAAACGWLSWHLVEKHALALKSLVSRPSEVPVTRPGRLVIEDEVLIEGGMSGSPMMSTDGKAIGLLSTGGANPVLRDKLPAWFFRR